MNDDEAEYLIRTLIGQCPKEVDKCVLCDAPPELKHTMHLDIAVSRDDRSDRFHLLYGLRAWGTVVTFLQKSGDVFLFVCLYPRAPDHVQVPRCFTHISVRGEKRMIIKLPPQRVGVCCLAKAAYYISHVVNIAKICFGRKWHDDTLVELVAHDVKHDVTLDDFKREVAVGLQFSSVNECEAETWQYRGPPPGTV